jgi:hypothetical protein
LGDVIDWHHVDTFEILTGSILVDSSEIPVSVPTLPGKIENPFTRPAISEWVDRLMSGYKITAVSGSDSKGVEVPNTKWGTDDTAVYADNLSRAALTKAVRAGHAYVQAKGARQSPEMEFTATSPTGQTGMFGDVLASNTATMHATVRHAQGQLLKVFRNRLPVAVVPITSDPFTYSFDAARSGDEGPLGTFYRLETADLQSLTALGNPIFLGGPGVAKVAAAPAPGPAATARVEAAQLPRTGGRSPDELVVLLLLLALAAQSVSRLTSPSGLRVTAAPTSSRASASSRPSSKRA